MQRFVYRQSVWAVILATVVFVGGCGGDDDGGTGPDPQPQTGVISGTVTADGAGVANAAIALSGAATRNTTTDATGGYRFADLAAGSYTLAITVPTGFVLAEAATRTITLTAGETETQDWQLQPGGGQQVVEVRLTPSLTFEPAEVTITSGTTVRWINDDATFHTVTPEDANQTGVWQRQTTNSAGVVFEHTFTAADETYDYFCEPHQSQGMTGSVTVQ